MSGIGQAVEGGKTRSAEKLVNNFSIQVATVNGTGSQSSNSILMRAIFEMGIPVSGKNLFPSNIYGMPTWFTIRLSERFYFARESVKEFDLLLAMNPATAMDDLAPMKPGSCVIYDEPMGLRDRRDDLVFYPVPFAKLAAEACPDTKLRRFVVNCVSVGVVARLLGIEQAACDKAVRLQFEGRVKAIELNSAAIRAGMDYAAAHLEKRDRLYVERRDLTRGMILIDGNTACALGCIFAGCTLMAWYPITPASSICERFIEYARKYRSDARTGKLTCALIQAEDELAALAIVLGAGWAGARAMTATSGPGVSLMAEGAGLGFYTEIPAVIFDVQRAGPSTGLPTRTSQQDLLKLATLSHGDTRHPILIPSNMAECFDFSVQAFDIAERIQTPVFVMLDLDLGMNPWISGPFAYPEKPMDRGKVLTERDLEKMKTFDRYRDVDGDGIPFRTLPGTRHPLAAYMTRGTSHNEKAQYTERAAEYRAMLDRIARKFETARHLVPPPIIERPAGATAAIVAYGSSRPAVEEARDRLRERHGIETAYMLIRGYPFSDDVERFLLEFPGAYVVDQNRSGQMAALLRMHFPGASAVLRPVLHYTGIAIDARTIVEQILAQEGERT
ncbi:MAG: 2-oxoacid:acceptor oxidoreductase subunit alpha [Planctomycetota bacterium]|nr:2-oxoacid:acceptor oxidoreductase subunit alpha [Planctomycetota bacterium]